jgi:hypothetical protein
MLNKMNKTNSDNTFDPKGFIDSLIAEMGMQDAPSEKLSELKSGIEQQMTHVILNTASMNLDPEALDYVMETYKDIENPLQLFIQIIKYNPSAQLAILDALDEFREQTLEAFNKFRRK